MNMYHIEKVKEKMPQCGMLGWMGKTISDMIPHRICWQALIPAPRLPTVTYGSVRFASSSYELRARREDLSVFGWRIYDL